MDASNRNVKEKEAKRSITVHDEDIVVQDVFGVYTSVLPQIFQPGKI